MAAPSLLERVVAALFGAVPGGENDPDRQLVQDIIEMVVETVEPRVRLHARYRERLQGCVRTTIAWLRSHAEEPPDCILLSREAWSADPRVNAFFATPDEVAACLGHSRELRAFFADPVNAGVEEAFALLGMKEEERTVFAPKLEGETLKQDVAQVAVSFSVQGLARGWAGAYQIAFSRLLSSIR